MTIHNTHVQLSDELDTLYTHDTTITKNGKYILWTENDDYIFSWIDLSKCPKMLDSSLAVNGDKPSLPEGLVCKYSTDENMVRDEPIASYIYTSEDDRVYILTMESETRIYVIHLSTATLQCCLIPDAPHRVCQFFIGTWPKSGNRMLMMYCMDNTIYSYQLDLWINHSRTTHHMYTNNITSYNMDNNVSSSIGSSIVSSVGSSANNSRNTEEITIYFIEEHSHYAINGWIYHYLPLTIIQGHRVVFYDGWNLCCINLENKKWDKERKNIYADTIHPILRKRIDISSDNTYIYVVFFNGTISQYKISPELKCICHYNIQTYPYSKLPLSWLEYMNPPHADPCHIQLKEDVPIIPILPPLDSNRYFIGHEILENIADDMYGANTANTWRLLDTTTGPIIYKTSLEYIQPLEYIEARGDMICYRCNNRIITIANLDMPLTYRNSKYFPTIYRLLISGQYYKEAPEVIRRVSQLPYELIKMIYKHINLASAIKQCGLVS